MFELRASLSGSRLRVRGLVGKLEVVALGLAVLWVSSPAAAEHRAASSRPLLPAQLSARASAVRHFEYVFAGGSVDVYDIDHGNRYLGHFNFPVSRIRGLVADPATGTLFGAYGGSGGSAGPGSMLAYNLVSGKTLWQRDYATGVDNIAITPNGRALFMAVGESSNSSIWEVIDPANGKVTGSISAGSGPHETIIGPDGKYLYLGAVNTPYLEVASTSTDRIVRKVGPLHSPGVRPFTINAAQTFAFTTSWSFLGFQVSSLRTGKVLYSASPPGFRFDPATFRSIPDHGISLSPDGRQLYLIDTPNGYVHVFDVSGLPRSAPRDI